MRSHIGDDPALCCLPGAWDRITAEQVAAYGEPLPEQVAVVAAAEGVDPHDLAEHVEALHGWEPHDKGYLIGVSSAAACMRTGACR